MENSVASNLHPPESRSSQGAKSNLRRRPFCSIPIPSTTPRGAEPFFFFRLPPSLLTNLVHITSYPKFSSPDRGTSRYFHEQVPISTGISSPLRCISHCMSHVDGRQLALFASSHRGGWTFQPSPAHNGRPSEPLNIPNSTYLHTLYLECHGACALVTEFLFHSPGPSSLHQILQSRCLLRGLLLHAQDLISAQVSFHAFMLMLVNGCAYIHSTHAIDRCNHELYNTYIRKPCPFR